MFCPNCGKDCGEAKFCSECGQDLRTNAAEQSFEDRKKQLQAEGQTYCPKCLSTSYTANKETRRTIYYRSVIASLLQLTNTFMSIHLERRYGIQCTCLQCGNSWFPKIEALHEHYKKHVLELLRGYSAMNFTGVNGACLQLCEDQVIIYHSKKERCVVPYEKLAKVDHRESIGPFYGRLSIRDRSHQKKSLPKTFNAAMRDRFTILYTPGFAEGYRQAYSALKSIVEENRKAGLL